MPRCGPRAPRRGSPPRSRRGSDVLIALDTTGKYRYGKHRDKFRCPVRPDGHPAPRHPPAGHGRFRPRVRRRRRRRCRGASTPRCSASASPTRRADLQGDLVARIVPNPPIGAWEAAVQGDVAAQGFPTPAVRLTVPESNPLGPVPHRHGPRGWCAPDGRPQLRHRGRPDPQPGPPPAGPVGAHRGAAPRAGRRSARRPARRLGDPHPPDRHRVRRRRGRLWPRHWANRRWRPRGSDSSLPSPLRRPGS